MICSPMPGDGAEMYAAVTESFEELSPWMPWPEKHKTVADSEESVRQARVKFMERSDLMLLLFLKDTNTLVGSSGLNRMDWRVPKFEIGYWCRTRFAGQGYITEAVDGITAFAFESLGANRVEIRCDSLNHRSYEVAERAGFRFEGELRNAEASVDGGPRNVLVYATLPEEHRDERERS